MLSTFESPTSQFFAGLVRTKIGGGVGQPGALSPQPAPFVAAGGWTTSPQVPQERPRPRCALTRPGTSTVVASGLFRSNLFNCNGSNIFKAMFPLRYQNTPMFSFFHHHLLFLWISFEMLAQKRALFFFAPLFVYFFELFFSHFCALYTYSIVILHQ